MIRHLRVPPAGAATPAGCGSTPLPRQERRTLHRMPNYTVKEIFFTLQGEGFHTGRAAVFCRFAGCNLWTGREEDRATAVCSFCDTDFVGVADDGGRFAKADTLADVIASLWPVPNWPKILARPSDTVSNTRAGGSASRRTRSLVFANDGLT